MKKVDHIRALTGLLVICFLFTSIISRAFNNAALIDASETESAPVKQDSSDTQLFDEEEGEEKSERDPGDGKFYKTHFDALPLEFFVDARDYRHVLINYSQLSLGDIYFADFPLYLSQRTLLL